MMIDVQDAERDFSRLIDQACAGEEVVITRGSGPVAKLVPIARPTGKRIFGSMRGKITVGPEFFESPNDDS